MKNTFEDHKKWVDASFPNETADEMLSHLKKEVDEISKATSRDHKIEEYADAQLLLFSSLSRYGFSYEELTEAVQKKMVINSKREWVRSEDGHYKHVNNQDEA